MADKKKPDKKKLTRVQFPKGTTAEQIADVIQKNEDDWAKRHPERAHRLYPDIWDGNGNRIKRDVGTSKNPK